MMRRARKSDIGKWLPDIGQVITAYLPFEMVRAVVEQHIDADTIQVRLSVQPPMGKGHSYRFRNLVTLHRQPGQPAGERWVADDK